MLVETHDVGVTETNGCYGRKRIERNGTVILFICRSSICIV